MEAFVDLHFKPALLKSLGLSDMAYAITRDAVESAMTRGGALTLEDLLYGLQVRSSEAGFEWASFEENQSRLILGIRPGRTAGQPTK